MIQIQSFGFGSRVERRDEVLPEVEMEVMMSS
jgi:hypothetical protein